MVTAMQGLARAPVAPAAALAAIGLAAVTAGCFEDRYRCTSDRECDLGEGGRCELDGHCTAFDPACPAARRYTAHSEDRTGTCFDDRTLLANPCAGGQPPAAPDPCTDRVCDALPACCETGWSDACVQLAQLRCELTCTTQIAITASRGQRSELWELAWDGAGWTATPHPELVNLLAWVAPPPGELAPRLAGFSDGGATLVVGARSFPALIDRAYQAITSVDLDRDGRDTAVLTYQTAAPQGQFAEVIKLDTGDRRDIATTASIQLAWGDTNRDGFPDAIAGVNARYTLLDNADGDDHVRTLASTTSSNVAGMATDGSPALRNFDWIDLDGDRALDLVVFGSSLRVHAGATIGDQPLINVDCDPPGSTCMPEQVSYAGAALPEPGGPALAVATFLGPGSRRVFRVAIAPGPPVTAAVQPVAFATPCAACLPIIALLARDLDGDHQLDLIGIDPDLQVYTGLARDGLRLELSTPIRPAATGFATVRASATGVPR